MKTYRIEHREELVDYFYIKANSEAEALAAFDIDVANGAIDLGQMELITASNTAEEVPDD